MSETIYDSLKERVQKSAFISKLRRELGEKKLQTGKRGEEEGDWGEGRRGEKDEGKKEKTDREKAGPGQ